MKTAAKVFAILGIAGGLIILLASSKMADIIAEYGGNFEYYVSAKLYTYYGIYALIISIASLCSLCGKSKAAIIAFGILNLPVSLLGSIFMFCSKTSN